MAGATLDDTLLQVTERLERKLQEVPHLDFLRSYTTAGRHDHLRQPAGRTPPDRGARHLVPGPQEGRRHPPYLPDGIVGPGFNDDFGDTFGIIYGFTADGFSHRELRD